MGRFASLFGRRGVLVAAVVAAGLAAFSLAQDLIGAMVSALVGLSINQMDGNYLGAVWQSQNYAFFAVTIPFALGIFASLWLLAPVAAELRLAHVVSRSLLAAGIGASLVVIVSAALGLVFALSGMGSIFSNSFPSFDVDRTVQALVFAVQAGLGAFVQLVPVVVLAGVFLWLWLQKHPPRHAVSGMLDEV